MFDIKLSKVIDICKLCLDIRYSDNAPTAILIKTIDDNVVIDCKNEMELYPCLYDDFYLIFTKLNFFNHTGILRKNITRLTKLADSFPCLPKDCDVDYTKLGDIEFQLLTLYTINEVRSMIICHILIDYIKEKVGSCRGLFDTVLKIDFNVLDTLSASELDELYSTLHSDYITEIN